jgi:sec-independent protein translocase protein TatA
VEFFRAAGSHRIALVTGHQNLPDLFEIALILAIALIVVGPERLPEVMRTVGKILRELRLASNTVLHELTDVLDEPPANISQPPKSSPEAVKPPGPPATLPTENK